MTSIQMPQLGETIIEGTILKWLKQEGDTIERDEPLFEISTDKVDTEVPSPVAGTVTKILVPEGETVAVGTELAEIDSGDGAAAAPATPAAAADDSAEDPAAEVPAVSNEEPVPTPQAARPAAQAPAAAAATTASGDAGPWPPLADPLAVGAETRRRTQPGSVVDRREQAPVAASPNTMWKPPSPPAPRVPGRLRCRA